MQSHTGCICLTFLHCEFSNDPSNRLHNRMHSCIGCICLTFLYCVVLNSSGFSHLHPSNQSNHFQGFAPFPLCVVFCPNCCFKLIQIYHWLLVSNITIVFFFFNEYFHFFIIKKALVGKIQMSCQKLPYGKNAIHFLTIVIFPYGNFPRYLQEYVKKTWEEGFLNLSSINVTYNTKTF